MISCSLLNMESNTTAVRLLSRSGCLVRSVGILSASLSLFLSLFVSLFLCFFLTLVANTHRQLNRWTKRMVQIP